MARASFRVHLVRHHDGMLTGRLLASSGAVEQPPTGYGRDEEQVFGQLALAIEENRDELEAYVWNVELNMRRVKVQVHPQTVVKKRHVIAREQISLDIGYVWSELERGGYKVMVPRFGWWFVLEDVEMAGTVIKQAVSTALLGEQARSLYEFRTLAEERVVQWSPTLAGGLLARSRAGEESETPTLHAVAEDVVARERRRRGKPLVGDADLRPYMDLVLREEPRSLVLVGTAGVGKTTWVRALARALGRVPSNAGSGVRIWSTSADRIVAGMAYLGQWEQRCLDLIDELSGEGDYLYVDQLAPLLAPRSGRTSIADMFVPAMQAGDMRLLGECTPEEYERLTTQAPAFMGLFYPVQLSPPASAAMPALMQAYQALLDPKLRIDGAGLRRLVLHLEFFQRDMGFPGKAFRFLDWLNQEREAKERDPEIVEVLGAEAVSQAFARATGLPLELISESKIAGREVIAGRLAQGVIGQDEACSTAARVLTRFKAGLSDPDRPVGSLFFVGPTGVGKTELAKQLARYMFGDADRMIRLDMSEYMLRGSAQRLLAIGRGVRSLVERIRQTPMSLILLDEIEKANAEVFDLMLAMLGEGRMTDTTGRLVDFRMAVVVMTSNLGVRDVGAAGFAGTVQDDADLLAAVRNHFRPEFFNRIDHVVPFRNLSAADILRVVDLEVRKASERAGFARRGLVLDVNADARAALARAGWHPRRGARPLKRVIEERVMSPLAVLLAEDRKLRDARLHVVADAGGAARLRAAGSVVVDLEGL